MLTLNKMVNAKKKKLNFRRLKVRYSFHLNERNKNRNIVESKIVLILIKIYLGKIIFKSSFIWKFYTVCGK